MVHHFRVTDSGSARGPSSGRDECVVDIRRSTGHGDGQMILRLAERQSWWLGHIVAIWGIVSWPLTGRLTVRSAVWPSWMGTSMIRWYVGPVVFVPALIGTLGSAVTIVNGSRNRCTVTVVEGSFALISFLALLVYARFGALMVAVQ